LLRCSWEWAIVVVVTNQTAVEIVAQSVNLSNSSAH